MASHVFIYNGNHLTYSYSNERESVRAIDQALVALALPRVT